MTLDELKKLFSTEDLDVVVEELRKRGITVKSSTIPSWGRLDRGVPSKVALALNRPPGAPGQNAPITPLKNGLSGGISFHADFALPAEMLDRWDPASRIEAFKAYRALVEGRSRSTEELAALAGDPKPGEGGHKRHS